MLKREFAHNAVIRHCIPSHNQSASQAVALLHHTTSSVLRPITYSTSIPIMPAPPSLSDHHQPGQNVNPHRTHTLQIVSATRIEDTVRCPTTPAHLRRRCLCARPPVPVPTPPSRTGLQSLHHLLSSSSFRAPQRLTRLNLTIGGSRPPCSRTIRPRWTRVSSGSVQTWIPFNVIWSRRIPQRI